MTSPIIATKCYGFEWMLTHELTERAAAERLAEHGIDWALLQNRLDPLPASGVEQAPPADSYDDRRFRDHIRARGIKYFESTAVFFQPEENRRHPELRPVDAAGNVMEPFDWYLGVSPHSRRYLSRRAELMEQTVSELDPDGVFLSFIRFPGFWEGWTPRIARRDIEDFGFSDGALQRFQEDTETALPDERTAAVRVLRHELAREWVSWKASVVVGAVEGMRDAARRARTGVEVMINGLPFAADERGDLGREVAGQDLGAISRVADHIETMVYHQIMGREASPWIEDTIGALRPRVRGTLLGSVQTGPAYTTGMHRGFGRSESWSPAEFASALSALSAASADGVSVYHWSDLVADEERHEGEMVRALRAYKEGAL